VTAYATRENSRVAEHYGTDDVDQLSERYYAAPIDLVQVEPGRLGANIYAVATSKVELREAYFESAVLNVVEKPMQRFGIGLGISGQAQMFGTHFTNSNLAYLNGRNGVIARVSAGSGWCNLSIDQALLQQVATVHGYVIPAGDDSYGLPTAAHATLVRRLTRIARMKEFTQLSDKQFDDAIALLVLDTFNPPTKRSRREPAKYWVTVQEVMEYIHANYTKPMTLTGLCQLVGVSERTLRYYFLKATGLSLQQYLTHYRLHRARALLAGSKVAEVGDAALACGIPHTGRFSQYFKALFGESPSHVLKQPPPLYRGGQRFEQSIHRR
jgi:AraC-like DNA-binding protein